MAADYSHGDMPWLFLLPGGVLYPTSFRAGLQVVSSLFPLSIPTNLNPLPPGIGCPIPVLVKA